MFASEELEARTPVKLVSRVALCRLSYKGSQNLFSRYEKQVIQNFIYQLTRVGLILGWFISGPIRLKNHEILVELSLIEPILSPGATIELDRLNGSTQHFREPTQ